MEICLRLPWPPSVNRIWRTTKTGKMYMTKEAKAYKHLVWVYAQSLATPKFAITDVLHLGCHCYPPDKRSRDLDNLMKIICDSLQYSGIIPNDKQIKSLCMEMHPHVPGTDGWIVVNIKSLDEKYFSA